MRPRHKAAENKLSLLSAHEMMNRFNEAAA